MAASDVYARWSPRMLSVLRIITGLLFLEHGTQKLLGFPAAQIPGRRCSPSWGCKGCSSSAAAC